MDLNESTKLSSESPSIGQNINENVDIGIENSSPNLFESNETSNRLINRNEEIKPNQLTEIDQNELRDFINKIIDEFDPLTANKSTNNEEEKERILILKKQSNEDDQTNLESENFSQTNTDQIRDQSNLVKNFDLVNSKSNIQNNKLNQQDKQTQFDQLDPNELSDKLFDLKTDQTYEAKEATNNLPDLISSSSIDSKKQPEKKTTQSALTTKEDIPSYQVKWIKFRNKQCAIITQNVNGPCPLLAIMNVLLLRGKISLPLSTKQVTYDQMIVFLANFILENGTNSAPEGFQLDYEQNINDAMQLFPKLQTGLDVNVQFNSITSFEYTSEMIIFDLLGISLYHGWIVDQDDVETVSVVGNYSYNQLVDKIITNKSSNKSEEVSEALIGERFLESTASQLTYYGLSELASNVIEQELSILFRNNHFITLYKNQSQLYQLVTDQGFLQEPDVVWMTLSHIDNDDVFVNHEFKPSIFKTVATLSPSEQKKQIDQDYLIALCMEEEEKKLAASEYENELNTISDEEFARKLQEEDIKFKNEEEEFKGIDDQIVRRKYENFLRKAYVQPQQHQYSQPQYYNQDHYHNQSNISQHQQSPQQQSPQQQHQLNREEYLRNRTRISSNNSPMSSASSENHTHSSNSSNSKSNHNSNNHKNKCIIS